MKNLTLLKIASLFIFLLSAQSSFGQSQSCSSYSDWSDYPTNTTWYDDDEVYYGGKIYSPKWYSTTLPLSDPNNRDETGCSGTQEWCFVRTCDGSSSNTLFYENFNGDAWNTTSGTDILGTSWNTDTTGSNPQTFGVRWIGEVDGLNFLNAFKARNVGGMPKWFTQEIDITNHLDLKLSLMAYGSSQLDANDYIKIYVEIDNVVQVLETKYDGFNAQILQYDIDNSLNGSSLEIFFEFRNFNGNEEHFVNNVKLLGVFCPAQPQYTVTGDDLNLCAGSTQTTTIGLNDSEAGVNYQLLKDGNVVSGEDETGTGSAISFGNFNATGTYTVSATSSCSTATMSDEVVITNVATPTADFTASANAVDTTQTINFTNNSTNASSYSWNFGDGTTSIETSPNKQYASAGSYTVTLTATNSCGSDTATTTITVNFGTDILFSEDQADASQSGSTISGSGTSATNASGITWTMNDPGGDVKVHNGDHIHCSKLDGDTVTWETEDIIISGYTNLNFTVFARKIEYFGSSDYIKLQYSIDGGTTRVNIATYNTNLTNANIGGDINTLTSTTVAGDTLKIYIEVYIDGNNQKFEWEDITLTGIPFYNVWQGTESDLVTNTAKWSKGSQPTAASNVWIPNTKHLKLTDDQAYNTVNARATSQLTIEKTGSLTTVGDFTKIAGTGTVTLNSSSTEFASIVVGATASGNITYNKFVNLQGNQSQYWDLVGSPVLGQDMAAFADTNTANNGPLSYEGNQYGIGQFLTDQGYFENYTGTLSGGTIISTGGSIENAGDFPAAKGFQMATFWGDPMAFTGEVATTKQTINIQNQNGANGGGGLRWNLVANPFPSYLKGNGAPGSTDNFLRVNAGIIQSNYLGVYGWKADGTYDVYNYATGSQGIGTDILIAPGQGFFVAAASTDVAQLQFTPAMRTVDGGDDFISGAPMLLSYNFDLKLFHGNSEKAETKYFFQEGLTLDLDVGYDAGALNQLTPLSSRLPEDNQGVNFQINAMSLDSAYNQTVPLVINQEQGQSFRISISNNTLPENVYVYLEDAQNGTLTSLKDQDFELIAQEDLSEDGRFYIRFATQNLAVNDVLSPSTINVYKINTDSFITIKGLSPEMGKTTATLYNMLGMKVRENTLNNTAATQQISTQGLASGVYIIKIKVGEQGVSKKVIIQ